LGGLDAYLDARAWQPGDGSGRRIVSHLLTYPLTLASALHRLKASQEGVGKYGDSLSIVCVGARAEASLPLPLWRELLFACPWLQALNIHFIGLDCPGVSPAAGAGNAAGNTIRPAKAGAPSAVNGSTVTATLEGRSVHFSLTRGLLHAAAAVSPDVRAAATAADAFVLFNPGLAAPALRDGWRPTLDFLLPLRRPVVMTSHSDADADADAALLR
ncbi:unnamed protein product, partial [Phaeothamnion confervicola]